MNSSLFTGVLGLLNHQTRMDVIGNNIANVNTYGFKKGRATFADLLSRTYQAGTAPDGARGGTNPLQVGMGMTTVSVTNLMNQGQLETTGRLTDVAINGNGWFLLQDNAGNTVYTRDGSFGLDRDGNLVNANGWKVQGWTRTETNHDHSFTVDTHRPTTSLDFQLGEKLEAQATNLVGLKCNLKSDSRSLVADGLDPKEGYATKDDTLVDLYKIDAGKFTPEHLGIREGDWVEVHAQASFDVATELSGAKTATANVSQGTLIGTAQNDGGTTAASAVITTASADVANIGRTLQITTGPDQGFYTITAAVAGVSYTLSSALTTTAAGVSFDVTAQQDFSVIPSTSLPVVISQVTVTPPVGPAVVYTAANLVNKDPDLNNDGIFNDLAANEWVYDQSTGEVILGSSAPVGSTITVDYQTKQSCRNTMPWQPDKFLYFQVTNDTDISDLESAIQQALDALDVNGTINAEVKYDTVAAKFVIYNNAVSGSQDLNDLKVDINAVSGSAIRQGFILQDSTDKSVKGTRLSLVNGGLGGNMTEESVGVVDYQTDLVSLDYGDVDSSSQIYAQVVSDRLEGKGFTFAGGNSIDLAQFSTGYTGVGINPPVGTPKVQMINRTDQLSVNGTVWTRVSFFTGANNEYVLSETGGVNSTPVLYFNTAAGLAPSANDDIVFTFRPLNAPKVLLTENSTYDLDPATGKISIMWSDSANGLPNNFLLVSDGLGNIDRLSGSIKITAQYTTEKRLLSAPNKIMDSRWADFVQGFAEVNAGGDGKARTDFDSMFQLINNKSTANPSGLIKDQATSAQPTSKESSLFHAGETHRTSIDVYDSLGTAHTLQFVFTHVGSYYDTTLQERHQNEWFWRAELPYSDTYAFDSMDKIDAIAQGIARLKGALQFDDHGLLQGSKIAGNVGPIMFDPSPVGANGNSTNSINTLAIDLDVDGHGKPIDGITQYASDFTTLAYEQNGWAMGQLQTFSIDQTGIIQGRYSNNIVKPIGQLALAMFPNEEGLTKEGANTFAISANTGTPTILAALQGGAGQISGGSLEMSNVDIAQEFTNMIVTERGFQANSRIITTSDEMLTEVINLKR